MSEYKQTFPLSNPTGMTGASATAMHPTSVGRMEILRRVCPGRSELVSQAHQTYQALNTNENEGFPGGSTVNNPPVMPEMQEIRVLSLGWEDLKEGMATHSSILAWRMP